jgi:hypothetical protein
VDTVHFGEIGREKALSKIITLVDGERAKEVVLWEGLCKAGQPDFQIFKGRGDNESVVLVPVPYKTIKGRKGRLVFLPDDNFKPSKGDKPLIDTARTTGVDEQKFKAGL